MIAWLWARTVRCPNPACGTQMPLIRTFAFQLKRRKAVWLEPIINHENHPPEISYKVKTGEDGPPPSPKLGRGAQFKCLACDQIVPGEYIKAEGVAGRIGDQLLAIVIEGGRDRLYIDADKNHEAIGLTKYNSWKPEYELSQDRRAIWCPIYGLDTFDKLFTQRQLVTLTTFWDLLQSAYEIIKSDLNR